MDKFNFIYRGFRVRYGEYSGAWWAECIATRETTAYRSRAAAIAAIDAAS